MGEDEAGTRARFNTHLNELIEPTIKSRQGRIVKTTGDGLLVEFGSVVDAVQCGVEIQQGMTERIAGEPDDRPIVFRIGVNLGDVIIEGDDIHGDGVNVAARLEGLAKPGTIVISGKVHEEIRSKLDLLFEDLGPQDFKNIAEPVHAFQVSTFNEDRLPAAVEAAFKLPSIAVLPFENMSGDPEQEYFSDGVSEDLITALSHVRQFRVVARNSTFSFKGKSTDIRLVAKNLGVRYVVEGSVRKAGNRIRVSVQLIEGTSGNHIWAKRYDRELEDIFAVQDELTETLVGAIAPEIGKAEQFSVRTIAPENLNAWECYQRAMWHLNKRDKDNNEKARQLFVRATELDPTLGAAFSGLAWTYRLASLSGDTRRDRKQAIKAAERALQLDPDDPQAHLALGSMYIADKKHEEAIAELIRAIDLNPSFAEAHHLLCRALSFVGRGHEAIPHIRAAIRLSPNHPAIGVYHAAAAVAHFHLSEYDDAIRCAQTAIRLRGTLGWAHLILIAAFSHLERPAEIPNVIEDLKNSNLSHVLSVNFVRENFPSSDREAVDRFVDGLRKAGVPE
jgi:adenylate cyclase